ncbi:MAG: hypothetical protein R3Y08_07705 [Rikenellaceae bacterium]
MMSVESSLSTLIIVDISVSTFGCHHHISEVHLDLGLNAKGI